MTPDSLPPHADRVVISVNPKAGRTAVASQVETLAYVLEARGFRCETLTDLTQVGDRTNQLHREGRLRVLVGVGGDGTARELVNRTDPGVPITLLATGTANLISMHFGLSHRPETLAETITTGRLLRLDAGQAGDRLFLVMISAGFDAEVVRQVHESRQQNPAGGHISYWSYLKPILGSIRSYRYPEIQVYCRDGDQPAADAAPPVRARWAFAFNLPCYGWGLPLAPAAVATDGLLDLCTFRRGSLWHGARYLAASQLRRHERLADCVCRRASRLRMTAGEPVPYQLDGDPGGILPVDIRVLPERFTLLVPR